MVRRLISLLPSNNREKPPVVPTEDPADRIELSLDSLAPQQP